MNTSIHTRHTHPLRTLLRTPFVRAMASPHPIDRYLHVLNPRWSVDAVRATVTAVVPQTRDMTTLVLRPNWVWQGFEAGQFVQLSVEIDGVRQTRCFSPANSTHRRDGHIELCFKAHADGYVTKYLQAHAAQGLQVTLSQAMGEFKLPSRRPERVLLISGGSGITPVLSMLRTLLDEQSSSRVTFVHYARSAQDIPYAEALAQLDANHPNLDLRYVYTGQAPSGATTGLFTAQQITTIVPDHAECTTFLCGPPSLMEAVSNHWHAIGAQHLLHQERFTLTPRNPTSASPGGDVHFSKSERYAPNTGESLLEQAEAAGLRPQHGCRMGICATCTCQKTSGVVRNLQTGQLSGSGEESIRLCISAPEGDVTVAL